MSKKQIYNPYLPLSEHIPDGEPHVFGDRVYIYGSHDKEGGETFCMLDYTVYSAPVTDLTDWRKEGVIYRADQDPDYAERKFMYAPDVVQGNDGRYYLYYCMSGDYGVGGYFGPIQVAVCDTPAGEYQYLGVVKNKDGQPWQDFICFDPGLLNDNGRIYLYSGTRYEFEETEDFYQNEGLIQCEMGMFGRSREEILDKARNKGSIMGPVVMELEDDMLTVKTPAKHLVPYQVKGTSFEGHPFFEASSMRKFNGKYYFIYSSKQNHELCYAISDYPDRDFTFGGTIVSNGDIGFEGRTEQDKMNMTGTTHGSIECINGEYYVFFHRLTHKSDYSRQACAEKITLKEDGSIDQVGITSCGLNGGPLEGAGEYPAGICCYLTNGHMPHGCNSIFKISFPNVTNKGEERFVGEICEGTLIGYKYFDFDHLTKISVQARIETEENLAFFDVLPRTDARVELDENHTIKNPGVPTEKPQLEIRLTEDGEAIGFIDIDENADTWTVFSANVGEITGTHPLFFVYHGKKNIQIKSIILG